MERSRSRFLPLLCLCATGALLLEGPGCKKSQDTTVPLAGSSDADEDMLDAFIPGSKPGSDVTWLTLEELGSETLSPGDPDSWKLSILSRHLLVEALGMRDPMSYEVRGDVDKVTLRRALRKGIAALANGRSYLTEGRTACQIQINEKRARAVEAYPADVTHPDGHVVILQQANNQKYLCTIPYDEAPELARRYQLYVAAQAALKKFFAAVGRQPLS